MSMGRTWKSVFYPWIPSFTAAAHAKRRKGLLYRRCPLDVLECQKEQDRIFWNFFLYPEKRGKFLEIGSDGIVGNHSLGLEIYHGWTGAIQVLGAIAQRRVREVRNCQVTEAGDTFAREEPVDLLAIHSPGESRNLIKSLRPGGIRPRWVVLENREPDPHWCHLLEGRGYKLKFYFHDDEYYELQA